MITKKSLTNTYLLILTVLTILTISTCQQWYQKGNPHFITQPDYQKFVINPQTRNKGVTILKFFTPWCRYCKFLKDIIDSLKSQATWSITIYQVNCDQVNHHFCSSMGVHSFPKMAVFENGQFQQSMDGFYPYQVVREIFVKYNRTVVQAELTHQIEPKNIHEIPKQQVKQPVQDQVNYVQPQIVAVSKDNQHKNSHKDIVETQNHKVESVKIQQKPITVQNTQHIQNTQHAQPKMQQQKHVQPVKGIQQKAIQTPSVNQHNNDKPNTQIHNQKVQKPVQVQTKTQLPKSKGNIKRTQQMIEQEQNIAIIDQNIKQTQAQKKIVQQVQKSTADTIDLTKFMPGQQHARKYGKYVIYAICIIVGFYYFVHIMKADPHNQQSKPRRQQSNFSSEKITKSQQLINKVSIQDSQMREELNFQHPNQQEVNFNSDQIRDQDL